MVFSKERKHTWSRPGAVVLMLLLALAVLVGCGGDEDSTAASGDATQAQSESEELTPFTILHFKQHMSMIPFLVGREEGIFEKHGIDLKFKETVSVDSLVPSVVSGDVQATNWTWGSLAVLEAGDIPVVAIAPVDQGPAAGESDIFEVVTLESSGITSFDQLEGKTIGVSSIGGLAELQVRKAAREAGIDPDSLKLTVVPFPNIGAALRAGRIDAGFINEPWLSQTKAQTPMNVVDSSSLTVMEDMPFLGLIAEVSYVEDNPDTIRKVQLATQETQQYARDHPEEIREQLTSWSGLDQATADEVTLPYPATEIDFEGIQEIADQLYEFDLLEEELDTSKLVTEFPLPEE